MLIKDIYTRVI